MGRVPDIPVGELDDLISRATGEDVALYVHEIDSASATGRVRRPSLDLASKVASNVIELLGIPNDQSVERLCIAVAAVAMRKLATSPGFTVNYGDLINPRETVRVDLRPDYPRHTNIAAEITEGNNG